MLECTWYLVIIFRQRWATASLWLKYTKPGECSSFRGETIDAGTSDVVRVFVGSFFRVRPLKSQPYNGHCICPSYGTIQQPTNQYPPQHRGPPQRYGYPPPHQQQKGGTGPTEEQQAVTSVKNLLREARGRPDAQAVQAFSLILDLIDQYKQVGISYIFFGICISG